MARETIARRSDGTSVLLTSVLGRVGLDSGETARKITFVDGRIVTVVDSVGAKTTWPRMSAQGIAQMKARLSHPPPNCVFPGDTLTGYGRVIGFETASVKWLPIGNYEHTEWRAPGLGCQSLQYKIEVKGSDETLKLLAEGRATSLKVGEPDPQLFDEGVGYVELKPSDMLRRQVQKLGIPWDSDMQHWGEERDKVYLGSVAPTGN
jgi:hypothetical protein